MELDWVDGLFSVFEVIHPLMTIPTVKEENKSLTFFPDMILWSSLFFV